MKSNVIAVVGGGASAVSFLDSLAREYRDTARRPLTVFLVEKRRFTGRGLAYDADLSTNLLNTRAGYITPFPDKPGHFYGWLTTNRHQWEEDFPGLAVDEQTFVPRPLFGLYLEYMMSELSGRLAQLGINLVQLRAEVLDMHRTNDGDVILRTDTSLTIRADQVILSCGNLQSREYSALDAHPGFHSSPYPIKRLTRTIDKDAGVAILGARLSAIDIALGLAGAGHRGPMTMVSRSGYYPSVRGTQGRYVPRVLTLERIRQEVRKAGGRLALATLVGLAVEECAHAGCGDVSTLMLPPAPPRDPLAWFEAEIAAAARPRPWQAVLYATNSFVDYAWQYLDEADKVLFLKHYQAAWMAYRVSIPVENAEKLVALAKAGRLRFANGTAEVATRAGGGFDVALSGPAGRAEHGFDAVIGAFGSPRDPALLDSRLVANLLGSGLARAHRHGGIDVDGDTNRLIDAHGWTVPNIRVIGELTSGVYFFTSVLEINARHAARCAHDLMAAIAATQPAVAPATAFALARHG